MPRLLTNLEVDAFLKRHRDIWNLVQQADMGAAVSPLAYPNHGLAVKDPSGRYVLVWRDASRKWWYVDLADMTNFAIEVNKPPYVAPNGNVLDDILAALAKAGGGVTSSLKWLPIIMALVVALALVNKVRA